MKKTKKLLVLFSMAGCLLLLMGAFNSGFAQNKKVDTQLTITDITVGDISDTEVNIKWKTNEPCTSKVNYGTEDSLDETVELDSDYLVTDHTISITDLDAGKIYSFKIIAKTENDNISSEMMSVTTLMALEDSREQITDDLKIISPRAGKIVSGTINVQLEGIQVQTFERVEFSVDGEFPETANGFPFEYKIDTTAFENGSHIICADGYDIQGKKYSHCVSVLVKNGRDDASFRFVVIGDTRSNDSTHKRVIADLKALTTKPVMIINSGDLTARGSSNEWKRWDDITTQPLGIDWNVDPPQYIGAYGNHDGGNSNWKKYLVGQQRYEDGKTFFISYGKVLFLVLNSQSNTKKSWIENTLKAQAPKHDWIFAFWHHPPYPFGSKSMDSSYKDFCPTLQKYGVNVLFVGHAHYYARSFPIIMDGSKNPKKAKSNEKGIVQVISGGAGASLYSVSKNVPYKQLYAVGKREHHYCIIDITSNIMKMEVKNLNGQVIDTLRLELKGGGDNPPTSEVCEPKNNSTVNGIQKVHIRATDDKGIQKIEVFANHQLLKTFTAHPFSFDWDTTSLSNGSYTIKGVVTDTSNQSTADSVTVTVNNNGPNPPVNQVIASDDFEEFGWKGGKGWSGAWKKSGDVKKNKLNPYKGKKYTRLRAGTGKLERTIDLSRVNNPVLKFASRIRSFEGNDKAVVKVSSNGVTYVNAMEFTSQHSDNIYHEYEIDLSRYNSKSSTFKIVFAAEMDKVKDLWYIDDILITGSK